MSEVEEKTANQDKEFLRTEPLGKLLLRLALPTVAAQLINMLYNIVDRIYIGHIPGIGATALTGVGVCMPLIMIVSAFAALVGYGGSPRASIFMGRKDGDTAEKILGNCFVLQIIISVVLTAVLLIWNRDFLMAFGASENTIEYAVSYMNIYALGTIFVELTLGMNAFITAQGFAKTGMLSVLIGAVANIILDPIFIFGFDMDVRGGSCHNYFPGAVLHLGGLLPLREEDLPEDQKEKSQPYAKDHPSLPGAGRRHFYHAGQRERDFRVLQQFPSELWRRYRGGSYDDSDQRHAVCHASAAGAGPGSAAHHQLLLRRQGYRKGKSRFRAAFEGQSGLCGAAVDSGHAVPGSLRGPVYI